MRFLLKLIALVVLTPIALVVLAVAGAAAVVGLPLLWESLVGRYTAPPKRAE